MTTQPHDLHECLRDRGFRLTDERRVILERVARIEGHFDAEGLCAALRGSGAKVSRATVYRTIGHLVDAGVLRKYDLGDRRTLYETAVGRHHHEHMICVVCGDILEFVEDRIERLQDDVCRKVGFRPLSHTLHIHGVCRRCDRRGHDEAGERPASDDVPMVWRKQTTRSE